MRNFTKLKKISLSRFKIILFFFFAQLMFNFKKRVTLLKLLFIIDLAGFFIFIFMLQLTNTKKTLNFIYTRKNTIMYSKTIYGPKEKNDYYRKPAENLQKNMFQSFFLSRSITTKKLISRCKHTRRNSRILRITI